MWNAVHASGQESLAPLLLTLGAERCCCKAAGLRVDRGGSGILNMTPRDTSRDLSFDPRLLICFSRYVILVMLW